MDFVKEFVQIRKYLEEQGLVFPSLAAWDALTRGESHKAELDVDDYYAHIVLQFGRYRLTFVACYTADTITNIQLWDGNTPVFYSGEE